MHNAAYSNIWLLLHYFAAITTKTHYFAAEYSYIYCTFVEYEQLSCADGLVAWLSAITIFTFCHQSAEFMWTVALSFFLYNFSTSTGIRV